MVRVTALALLASTAASAHPMGTLSTNRSAHVHVGAERISVDYVVQFAEVPSVPEVERIDAIGAKAWATERMGALQSGLSLTLDGDARALTVASCSGAVGKGEGDLRVATLDCLLTSPPSDRGVLQLRDANFANTVGWREIVVVGEGLTVGLVSPAGSLVADLPPPFASSGLDVNELSATIGAVGSPSDAGANRPATAPDAFADLLEHDSSTTFLAAALAAAAGLGAAHALSPGHGKTIVAAYLVGSRGTVAQALLLGLVVTATHVSSVLALGLVTLFLSQYVVAAELYPAIGVASGLGVVGVGATMLRSRLGHDHGPGTHTHVVRDATGEPVGLGRLLVLGVTGGAVPCPSALVVLLAAVAQHRVGFGLALIVAFSVGLAAVLMAIGVLVVRAGALLDRLGVSARRAALVPVVSAVLVIGLGVAIALRSLVEGGVL